MARRKCPGCGEPLPFAARRCRRCGPLRDLPGSAAGRRRRRSRIALAVTAVVLVLGAIAYRVGAGSLGEWYAEFALRHLPAPFTSWAPADTPTGAFYACVQRVARQVSDRSSVETFPHLSSENTVVVAAGHYRVRSYLEVVRESGEKARRAFSCEVRYDRGRWVVDRLAVEGALAAR